MNKNIILLFLCIIVIYNIFVYIILDDTVKHKSSINGNVYSVRNENFDQKDNSANFLAKLHMKSSYLVNYMYKHQLPNIEIASRLKYNWDRCSFRETHSSEKSVAYTVNKGDEMRVCIRDSNGTLEDENTSFFVILHELAHLMSVSYGHENEFKENFSYIVHLASKLGLYKPQDFFENPITYCGITIHTTPCINGSCQFNPKNKIKK